MTELDLRRKSKSFDANGLQFAWDSSTIQAAQKCLRYYQLHYLQGWSPRGHGVHLRFGGHFATALEHFYKHRALGLEIKEALRLVVAEALNATWDRPTCPKCLGAGAFKVQEAGNSAPTIVPCSECEGRGTIGEGHPWNSGHNTKTRENLIRTIVWYVDQFAAEAITVHTLSNGKPAVEYSFTIPVDGDIVFAGHIDRLVHYNDDIMVMDQKTTGQTIAPYWFGQFKPHTQMSMYTFAGKIIYDIPVKGVIIDGAQIAVGFTRFMRGFTFRTPSELDEWYADTLNWIELARKATAENNFPMNPASCGNYGGCEFRGICSKPPEVRAQFLKGDFVQGPLWDPLERR